MAHISRRCLAALALASTLVARPITAGEKCSVRLDPPQTGGGWETAAREANGALASSSSSEADCADIVVKVTATGAVVLFTTRDGRKAFRDVPSPKELVPTIVALMVTFEPTTAAQPDRESSPSAAPPVPSTPASIVRSIPDWEASPEGSRINDASQATRGGRSTSSLIVRAQGGVRTALPGSPVAPTLGMGVTMVRGRWEGSVTAQWEPAYVPDATSRVGRFRLSAASLGLAAGRREPLGSMITLVFGPAVFATMATIKAGPELGNVGRARLEPRFGLFAALVFGLTQSLHVRLSLAGDLNPLMPGHERDDVPVLPPWGIETNIGLEWKVP